jgi:hypothetical protein
MSYNIQVEGTITGPVEIVQEIAATGFSLNTLYPQPDREGMNVTGWRYVYWGTGNDLSGVVINHTPGDVSMNVTFYAAGDLPFMIFLYLAKKYPEIRISAHYDENNCESVGHISNEGANCTIEFITPIFYSVCAMRCFSETSPWFDTDAYLALLVKKGVRYSASSKKCEGTIHSTKLTTDYDTRVGYMRSAVFKKMRAIVE